MNKLENRFCLIKILHKGVLQLQKLVLYGDTPYDSGTRCCLQFAYCAIPRQLATHFSQKITINADNLCTLSQLAALKTWRNRSRKS